MTRLRTALLIALISTAACGGDDTINQETICNQEDGILLELLDKVFECNPELVGLLFLTPESADVADACDGLLGDYVTEGSVLFGKRASARACRDAIEGLSCEEFDFDLVPECKELLLGQIPSGAGCEADVQCEGDSYCDRQSNEECGVCLERKPDGASCDSERECVGRNCSEGECLTPGVEGEECNANDDCLGRLGCNRAVGECQRVEDWEEGDPCVPGEGQDDCGAFVTRLYCGPDSECTPLLQLDDNCSLILGQICDFTGGLYCDLGTCAQSEVVGDGDACNLFLGRICDEGLLCSSLGREGVCQDPAQEGDACDPNAQLPCPGGLFMSCYDGVCRHNDYTGECYAP